MSDVTKRESQFLVKRTKVRRYLYTEISMKEQIMMRLCKEFVDKNYGHISTFEKKDYALTEKRCVKQGDLGFLSVGS
jgi:hypothetical protein